MEENKFLSQLEELLEMKPGSIQIEARLTDLEEWDSLAFVSFLAMADSKYGIKVTPVGLRECRSVRDLFQLLQKG